MGLGDVDHTHTHTHTKQTLTHAPLTRCAYGSIRSVLRLQSNKTIFCCSHNPPCIFQPSSFPRSPLSDFHVPCPCVCFAVPVAVFLPSVLPFISLDANAHTYPALILLSTFHTHTHTHTTHNTQEGIGTTPIPPPYAFAGFSARANKRKKRKIRQRFRGKSFVKLNRVKTKKKKSGEKGRKETGGKKGELLSLQGKRSNTRRKKQRMFERTSATTKKTMHTTRNRERLHTHTQPSPATLFIFLGRNLTKCSLCALGHPSRIPQP